MKTIYQLTSMSALIVMTMTAPAMAENTANTQLKEHFGLKPVAVKSTMPTNSRESSKPVVLEAKQPSPTNEKGSSENIPYVTYDGAENTNQ